MACEALQRRREALDRFDQRMLTQIDPGKAHMVRVMKVGASNSARLESVDKFMVVHASAPRGR